MRIMNTSDSVPEWFRPAMDQAGRRTLEENIRKKASKAFERQIDEGMITVAGGGTISIHDKFNVEYPTEEDTPVSIAMVSVSSVPQSLKNGRDYVEAITPSEIRIELCNAIISMMRLWLKFQSN
ncbi:hypothetical protein IX51_03870 [uncultured archaeon]|nr:hypothetical protein IX51_03870 [uncultured archaeon]